jgi:hypothetical protein
MRRLISVALLLGAICLGAVAQTPPAPANLVAQSPADLQTRVTLTWNSTLSSAMGFYRIYRSIGDSLSFQWIGIAQGNKFEDKSVVPGTLYYYYVTAAVFADSILRESGRSNIASIRAYALPGGPHGLITGRVVDQVTGRPLPKVRIRFFKVLLATNRFVETTTDPQGWYAAPLDSGTYLIRAEESAPTIAMSQHQPEWFDNATLPETAKPVRLAAGDTVQAHFALNPFGPQPYAYVSGLVTDDGGTPLSGVAVALVRPIQEMNAFAALSGSTPGTGEEGRVIPGIGYARGVVWLGYTNPQGKFYAQVLSGRPYVAMAAKDGYYPEVFDNTSDPTQATILTVHGDTTGINFSLTPKGTDTGTMQGTITNEDGNDVPARIILFPRPKADGERPVMFVFSDSTGTFEFNDLPASTYSVLAIPYSDYASAYYKSSASGTLSWVDADTVVVNGTPAAVHISLTRLQGEGLTRISGRIVNANQAALAGVRVSARFADGRMAGDGMSDPTGHYDIEAIPAGPVTLFVDRFRFNLVQSPVTVPRDAFAIDNVNFILTGSFPTGVDAGTTLPVTTRVYSNYPNPFNPATTIRFDLAQASEITLSVYDVLGREVRRLAQGQHAAGTYNVAFDGSNLSSGVYYYVLRAQGPDVHTSTGRMILMK